MKAIVIIAVALGVIVVGLSAYLAPDDLANCAQTPSSMPPCQPADAIIAISGGDTKARTDEAIALYQNDWGKKLIFSGAAQDKSGPSNAEAMRSIALKAGVPGEDILIEEASATTKENATKTQELFELHTISSAILVTSAYHQRRAGLEFKKQTTGVELRNHPVASDNQWSSWWWLTLSGWYLALSEFFKTMIFYIGVSR